MPSSFAPDGGKRNGKKDTYRGVGITGRAVGTAANAANREIRNSGTGEGGGNYGPGSRKQATGDIQRLAQARLRRR